MVEPRNTNTSINLSEDMISEIEKRREKGESRSEYIRKSIQARFQAEDEEVWSEIQDPLRATTSDA